MSQLPCAQSSQQLPLAPPVCIPITHTHIYNKKIHTRPHTHTHTNTHTHTQGREGERGEQRTNGKRKHAWLLPVPPQAQPLLSLMQVRPDWSHPHLVHPYLVKVSCTRLPCTPFQSLNLELMTDTYTYINRHGAGQSGRSEDIVGMS